MPKFIIYTRNLNTGEITNIRSSGEKTSDFPITDKMNDAIARQRLTDAKYVLVESVPWYRYEFCTLTWEYQGM